MQFATRGFVGPLFLFLFSYYSVFCFFFFLLFGELPEWVRRVLVQNGIMDTTLPVMPLTSYAETLPVASAESRKHAAHRGCSVLPRPPSAKTHRGAKKQSTQYHTPDTTMNNSGSVEQMAPMRLSATMPRDDISQGFSEGSLPLSDVSLTAALVHDGAARGQAGSCTSLKGYSFSMSHSRTGRAESDDPLARFSSSDSMPFATFTTHLRQRLAMSDTGVDAESSNNNTILNNDAPAALRAKMATPNTFQPLSSINSQKALFSATSSSPALPLMTLQTSAPLFSRSAVKSPGVCNPSGEATKTADASNLKALSSELTTLLQQADAAMVQLARGQRALEPEQLRCLTRMQRLTADAESAAELGRDVLGFSATNSVLPTGVNSIGDVTAKRQACPSGSLSQSPSSRMFTRP